MNRPYHCSRCCVLCGAHSRHCRVRSDRVGRCVACFADALRRRALAQPPTPNQITVYTRYAALRRSPETRRHASLILSRELAISQTRVYQIVRRVRAKIGLGGDGRLVAARPPVNPSQTAGAS